MRRRTFLKQSSLAGGALLLPSWVQAAVKPRQTRYDVIIVGAGTAGCIVARRLVDRFPTKSFLLIEAGGPTSVAVGGQDFPPYDSTATIFDVPGEYQNIPFQPKGEPYRQKETPFTYQGTGYGGNSQFNGMLFQAAPPRDFEQSWPRGWKYKDLRRYFALVMNEMSVSNTPRPTAPSTTGPWRPAPVRSTRRTGSSRRTRAFSATAGIDTSAGPMSSRRMVCEGDRSGAISHRSSGPTASRPEPT